MAQTFTACTQCNQVNRVPLESPEGRRPVCGRCKSALAFHDGISELTGSALGALVAKSPLPVIADFWAPWCGPCKAFAPVFERAARSLAGRVAFVKLNVDANPIAGDVYHVRGIPALVLFEGGIEKSRQSGALPLEPFLAWLGSEISAPRSKAG